MAIVASKKYDPKAAGFEAPAPGLPLPIPIPTPLLLLLARLLFDELLLPLLLPILLLRDLLGVLYAMPGLRLGMPLLLSVEGSPSSSGPTKVYGNGSAGAGGACAEGPAPLLRAAWNSL